LKSNFNSLIRYAHRRQLRGEADPQRHVSGRIPQHFIDELVARADLVEVVGSRVQLRKAGKEYKACCPFHDEKTPSFTVVPDKQFYHCFGCGAHGTAIGFLMQHDHLGFVEAVEDLAARVGLEVPREEDAPAAPRPSDDLYRTLERAAELYSVALRNHRKARDYLAARGIEREMIERFRIGYAPPGWDTVLAQLGTDEDARARLSAVGLIIEREGRGRESGSGGFYDRFRDRIVYPIRDARGRTIGFGGRIIDAGEPKYLNSPETELFHKGRELYGLYEARQVTRSLTRILVVEGYMDVVRLHQHSVTYAVATLGTATTREHLLRLFRVTNEVVFAFDGDRAGLAAAWRALGTALAMAREGRRIRFLFLPEGHDPDSLVGLEGQAAFEARVGGARSLSEYMIGELTARHDATTVDGRAQLADAARPLVARIPAGFYRELLVDELARVLRMGRDRLDALLIESTGSRSEPEAARSPPHRREPRDGAGRRNLVRQAIHLLVHFPAAATAVDDSSALGTIERPGIPLLVELLLTYREQPDATTGQLLERWRDRPDYQALAKLAARECLVPDLAGARIELVEAIDRLVQEEGPAKRLDALLEKGREGLLTAEEKLEFQTLLRDRGAARSADRDDRT
jgi:DNA primase